MQLETEQLKHLMHMPTKSRILSIDVRAESSLSLGLVAGGMFSLLLMFVLFFAAYLYINNKELFKTKILRFLQNEGVLAGEFLFETMDITSDALVYKGLVQSSADDAVRPVFVPYTVFFFTAVISSFVSATWKSVNPIIPIMLHTTANSQVGLHGNAWGSGVIVLEAGMAMTSVAGPMRSSRRPD